MTAELKYNVDVVIKCNRNKTDKVRKPIIVDTCIVQGTRASPVFTVCHKDNRLSL